MTDIYGSTAYEFGSNVRISYPIVDTSEVERFYSGPPNRFWSVSEQFDLHPHEPTRDEKLAAVTLDVVDPTEGEVQAFTSGLSSAVAQLRSLLVTEFAPVRLSVAQTWAESVSVLRQLTGATDLDIDDMGLKKTMEFAFRLRLVHIVADLTQLNDSDRERLYGLALGKHTD